MMCFFISSISTFKGNYIPIQAAEEAWTLCLGLLNVGLLSGD